jgi:chaperone required for assembly of F1-ATPase
VKRFYKEVSATAADGGYGVLLDGKTLKTPAGEPLTVPTMALAAALAEEWSAQGETIVPASMPLMQLASTALDRTELTRPQVLGYLAGFGGSDLLCYRAEAPSDLTALQAERWQPWLDWAARELDAPLTVTVGVVPVVQDESSLAALRCKIEAHDDWTMTAMQSLTPCLGSLVLALAVVEGLLEAEQAFELSRLDERFQAQLWGIDSEAKARSDGLRHEIVAAARLLDLLREG